MIFFSLIVVFAIVNFTSVTASLQQDAWFYNLVTRLRSLPGISSAPLLLMILAISLPLVVVGFCTLVILYYGLSLYLFFIYVPVFLYSLGRGNFIADVDQYIVTATRGDTVAASKLVDEMRGRLEIQGDVAEVADWKALHTQALKVISYRGFEKTFAVLFWFLIAGPLSAGAVGALLYRLSVIYRDQTIPDTVDAHLAEKWLWLIEMPAVRLMGLIWAFVGNFDSSPWRESLLDTKSSSVTILNNSLRGALSAPTDAYVKVDDKVSDSQITKEKGTKTEAAEAMEEAQEVIEDLVGVTLNPQAEPAYSFALVKSSVPLYTRSLLFCAGVIAFATLFI